MNKKLGLLLLPLLAACATVGPVNPALFNAQNSTKGSAKKLQIRLFRSYGNEEIAHVRARVMKPENQRPESPSDSSLLNFWRNLTSFNVSEMGGIQVKFSLNGKSLTLVSDDEGMIQVPAQAFGPLPAGIQSLRAELAPGQHYTAPVTETGFQIHPAGDSGLGIVSDIDDTIKVSNVTSKLKALRRLLFSNSYSSEPVPGIAVLYQLLEKRNDGQVDGDFTYISGSPLNLSDTIYRFMDNRSFPQGAIELKKWSFGGDDSPFSQQNFKLLRLRQLLTTYPRMSFLCFGDSGERDPEIYRQIANEYPGRIKDIFINNVTGAKPTDPRFAGEHLTRDTIETATLLQQNGLLTPEDVETVRKAIAAGSRP
ncbi:MAG: phosphatase domain-containing protein [Candidatus Sericytochromatia bacterium]